MESQGFKWENLHLIDSNQ